MADNDLPGWIASCAGCLAWLTVVGFGGMAGGVWGAMAGAGVGILALLVTATYVYDKVK